MNSANMKQIIPIMMFQVLLLYCSNFIGWVISKMPAMIKVIKARMNAAKVIILGNSTTKIR